MSKAIRPEPDRRYESVQHFADDLERYLRGQSVLARPQTLSYRARKFGYRNRNAAVITLAVIVTAAVLWLRQSGSNSAAPAAEPSIAVLPFVNLSNDPANRYFSDGLADEITGELSRVKTL